MSNTGQMLYRRARKVMPGGTQLLSKRPEMFLPEQWPVYFKSAKGAEVVDLDGKTYLDMSYCGIGATILGFDISGKDRLNTHLLHLLLGLSLNEH